MFVPFSLGGPICHRFGYAYISSICSDGGLREAETRRHKREIRHSGFSNFFFYRAIPSAGQEQKEKRQLLLHLLMYFPRILYARMGNRLKGKERERYRVSYISPDGRILIFISARQCFQKRPAHHFFFPPTAVISSKLYLFYFFKQGSRPDIKDRRLNVHSFVSKQGDWSCVNFLAFGWGQTVPKK